MKTLAATFCLLLIALAGCTGDDSGGTERTVALTDKDVLPNQGREAELECGAGATIVVFHGDADAGDITVTVRAPGANGPVTVFQTAYGVDSDGEDEADLPGSRGTWILRVDRSLEFDDSFRVTLRC